MTFLNPFILFGLAAAAIPILIHLLNLRKLRVVEFSSLQFLKELQRTSLRRLKIRQILLLVLRTLLVIALVLAFSRPVIRGPLAGIVGTRAATSVVILIDDSPSMSIRTERGSLFTQATEAARDILTTVEANDKVHILSLSSLVGGQEPVEPLPSVTAALARVGQLTESQISTPVTTGLRAASQILSTSPAANAEVFLITDGQATQFSMPPGQAADSVVHLGDRTHLYLITVPSREEENAAVASCLVKSQMISRNKPVLLETTVRNFGNHPMENSVVSLYLDGQRVAQQTASVQPRGSLALQWATIPKRAGFLEGYVQMEEDCLDADNRRYFVIHVPGAVRVLITGPSSDAMRFPTLALTLGGDTLVTGLPSIRQELEQAIPSLDLTAYDVVLWSGPGTITPSTVERLAQFVKSGGNLALFPGRSTDTRLYNDMLLAALGVPPAVVTQASSGGGTEQAGQSRPCLTFGQLDYAHPVFAGMFDEPVSRKKSARSIESPRVYTALGPKPAGRGHSIISLADGTSFLTEYKHGDGKILLFAVEPGLAWSDFPLKGIYAPLLHRSVAYLASETQPTTGAVVGHIIDTEQRLRAQDARGPFVLRAPDGGEEKLTPSFAGISGVARFHSLPTTVAGTYRLERVPAGEKPDGSGSPATLTAIPVNIAPGESDLGKLNERDWESFLAQHAIPSGRSHRLTTGEQIERVIRESRFGVELWKYCVALAILCALLELAIGRVPKQEPTR